VLRDNVLEHRAYGDQMERIPELAAELIRSGVDIFIVPGGVGAVRVQQVTRTIPIVTFAAGDLVQTGLAASLARPGGNVTGVQTLTPDLAGKHLSLVKEAIPSLSRWALLMGEPSFSEAELRSAVYPSIIRGAEISGKALGIRLQVVAVRRVEDFDGAFRPSESSARRESQDRESPRPHDIRPALLGRADEVIHP